MINMEVALDCAKMIDDRLNLLEHVNTLTADGDGSTDISTSDGKNLQAGTYVSLDGMPGGVSADINNDGVKENGVFDMGSTQGTLAVGLYQQITDTISQGLTSSIDQSKKIDTQIKRTLNS